MPGLEIIILIAVFILSFWLIKSNFNASLVMMLILSVLLHKEFFSIYRWDLLPIHIFSLAFVFYAVVQANNNLKQSFDREKIKKFFSEPFVLLISLYWLINALSLVFTKNLQASIFFFGFQSTVIGLGIVLYFRLKNDPEKIKKLIWTYIYIAFGLTIFGFIQLGVYQTTGFIFGALWNVHGRLPRIGATFWDVNHFAAFLASLLPVLGMFILLAKSWKKRLGYLGLFIPMGAMLIMTNSRTGWILAAVAFFVFLLIMLLRKWGMKGIYGLFIVLTLVSGLALFEYSDRASPFRRVIKDYFHYRLDSFDSHMLLLQGSFEVFERFPYLGGGTGGFFEHFSRTDIAQVFFGRDPISLTRGFRTPGHSIWGETLAETGALGMFVLVILMSFLLSPLLYIALTFKDKEKYLVATGMFSALFGWLVAAVFYSYKSEFFWLIFFFYFLYGLGILGKKYSFQNIYSYFLKSNKTPYIVIGLIGAVLIFWGLGSTHFIPWDEAVYAKIAKNMVNTGEYTVLNWNLGSVWFEKPPLYIWLAALSMKIFGITEFAARLPSALFGFFTLFLVYKFGKRMFNKTSAFIAALVMVTTTQYLYYARAAMMDVSVTFFITLAIYYYYKTFSEKGKLRNWLWIGLAIGLGGMIKSIVGLLPILVIGTYELILYVTKEKRLTKKVLREYAVTAASSMAIFFPWHIEMFRRFGGGFINNYLIYHIIIRGTSEIEQKGRPFWWYLIALKVSMRIWFVVLLGAFPFSLIKGFFKKSRNHIFLILWALVIFVFFSSAKSKIVWYIIPIYPVLSLMVGRFIERVYAWLIRKVPWLGKPITKSFFIYSLTSFALFYLFLVKNLVYTGDQTEAQAVLLQRKDQEFGLEIPVYVNKVEVPLVKYYTDGEYVDTDYRSLKNSLDNPRYDETIVFLTKKSRFEKFAEEIELLTLVETIKDHSLGVLPSQLERDTMELEEVQKEIRDLEKVFEGKISKGEQIAFLEQLRMIELQSEEFLWLEIIKVGLDSTKNN